MAKATRPRSNHEVPQEKSILMILFTVGGLLDPFHAYFFPY